MAALNGVVEKMMAVPWRLSHSRWGDAGSSSATSSVVQVQAAGTGHPRGTKQHVGCRCHGGFYSPSLSLCHLQFRIRICHNFYIIFLKSPAFLCEPGQHRAREDRAAHPLQRAYVVLLDFVCTLPVLEESATCPKEEGVCFPRVSYI